MTAVAAAVAALAGLPVGLQVDRAAERFVGSRQLAAVGSAAGGARPEPPRWLRPATVAATAVLLGLTTLRFGLTWILPAYLFAVPVAVLLAVVDLRCTLLPNRILLPSTAGGALLLAAGAAASGNWPDLARSGAAAVVLFAGYLALALLSPGGLGMGDVKLAALVGLYLGRLGWGAVVTGVVAGFLLQAAVALLLLATRRIGLRGELPFGPAMLAGAALAVAVGGAGPTAILGG